MVGSMVTGLGQHVAAALSKSVVEFKLMPITKKGLKRFPEGFNFSLPAWLIAMFGFTVAILAAGGAARALMGETPTAAEEKARKSVAKEIGEGFLYALNPFGAMALKGAGVT